jgi:hypothetical protein
MKTKDEPIQRGILFSKPMMEANIEGRKKETRRAVKPKIEALFPGVMQRSRRDLKGISHYSIEMIDGKFWIIDTNGKNTHFLPVNSKIKCPYGQPGDILYARETIWTSYEDGHIAYEKPEHASAKEYKCTPSIHMPKKHSRFWMEVLEVKAEKLLDISGNSCVLEGIEYKYNGWRDYMALCDLKDGIPCYDQNFAPRKSYFSLWDSINGKESHLLDPWVWVVTYKEIENPNL